ncbi:hypothetical protein PHYPO_G00098540 [Pangasianodon hypophthalmus]|uniref:Uncharacterized protein n=1 Tax=Pangasianodon hypophthalmus TaxID=310915 RepID=A0A5N5LBJ5_PANHP|nr:hypothetical protein PHYPO_G00098540 [Pangasianodon hypophthalmus]
MESAEDCLGSFRKSRHTSSHSQLLGDVQTEIDGGTSSSLEDITPVDYQKHVKEEPEDEGYLYGGTSSTVGHITPIDQQKCIKKEEPEDEENLYEEITIGQISPVDQQNKGFQSEHIKKEESEDEGYVCTTTVCG